MVSVEVYRDERELEEIMTLVDRDLSEPYSIFTYRYFLQGWPEMCYVARVDRKMVGVVVCKAGCDEPGGVMGGYIAMLAVDERHRRKGIGSSLVSHAIDALKEAKCKEIVLETETTNTASLKLYEGLGFCRDERLIKYYLNGVDAFRLKRWIALPCKETESIG